MRFEHRIDRYALRNYCTYHNLCTECTNKQYEEMLKKYTYKDLSPEDILNLVEDIYKYSDVENELFDFGEVNFMHTLVYSKIVQLQIRS